MQVTRLFDIIEYQLKTFPLTNSIVSKEPGHRSYSELSSSELRKTVDFVSLGLLDLGVKKGDKIAIISNNRTEWNIVDFAISQLGAVVVPIYPTISSKEFLYIFNHAEIKYAFVSSDIVYSKISPIRDKANFLKEIFSFNLLPEVNNWKEVMALGEKSKRQNELVSIKNSIEPDSLGTIIYTSGTTGDPKGVMLSQSNIVQNILGHSNVMPAKPGDRALSFLPLSHAFERMLVYFYMYHGVSVYYAESIEAMGKNLLEVHPNVMTVVPRLLEKVFDKIYAAGLELSPISKFFFFWALDLGFKYKPYKENGKFYEFKLAIARKLVFSKWKQSLGGNLDNIVVGGAALQERLATIFTAAEITIMEGYGMSEASPVISVNAMANNQLKIGTVGKPSPNISVKIADDGEILIKGPIVMLGYYKDEDKTKEVITSDGYLMTGDIGNVDSDGFISITDRKKEMFKTSGGKYVSPAVIENALKESRFIEQAMIVGEGRKMPVALIQLDFAYTKEWCKRKNIEIHNDKEIVENKIVFNRIERDIIERNKNFGNWEQVKKFELVPDVWTVDDGFLSQTLKLKRRVILKRYEATIEAMYA